MLRIGDFSKLSRVSIRILRHYDEIEPVKPVEIDSATGYQYYGERQLSIVSRIAALKDMGFGLGEIGEMLAGYDDKEWLANCLSPKRAELSELKNRWDIVCDFWIQP